MAHAVVFFLGSGQAQEDWWLSPTRNVLFYLYRRIWVSRRERPDAFNGPGVHFFDRGKAFTEMMRIDHRAHMLPSIRNVIHEANNGRAASATLIGHSRGAVLASYFGDSIKRRCQNLTVNVLAYDPVGQAGSFARAVNRIARLYPFDSSILNRYWFVRMSIPTPTFFRLRLLYGDPAGNVADWQTVQHHGLIRVFGTHGAVEQSVFSWPAVRLVQIGDRFLRVCNLLG